MTRIRRWTSALVVAVVATVVAAAEVPAVAAPTSPPRAQARITVSTATDGGILVAVRATRIAAGSPVVVSWGDGRTSRRTTTCTDRAARAGAARCGRSASATFSAPGRYRVEVRQGGRVLAARPVVVTADGRPTSEPGPEDASWRTDMLDRVNALRASVGAAPLVLCDSLGRAAQAYAADMAARSFFSHTSPEGTDPGDRVDAQGFHGRAWGENIAAGYRSVEAVMAGWIDSPGHYANLVRPAFTQVGFGRATSTDQYGVYWVQDFGAGGSC